MEQPLFTIRKLMQERRLLRQNADDRSIQDIQDRLSFSEKLGNPRHLCVSSLPFGGATEASFLEGIIGKGTMWEAGSDNRIDSRRERITCNNQWRKIMSRAQFVLFAQILLRKLHQTLPGPPCKPHIFSNIIKHWSLAYLIGWSMILRLSKFEGKIRSKATKCLGPPRVLCSLFGYMDLVLRRSSWWYAF